MMAQSRVTDLTVDELKALIREAVAQAIRDELDPDERLELQEDFCEELQDSLEVVMAGAVTKPAREVAARLGLDW